MSIKTKLAALAIAGLTLSGGLAATTQQAAAGGYHHHHHGIGIGLAAGALLGAAVAGSAYAGPAYVADTRRCGWVRQFDAYGNYIGRVRTCAY
ncbi:MAG: hypothetical protein J0G28_05535 [Afipia sp.]|nr:hypothetical protein [Afipia sp.]OJW60273.1 MAG: hypothetical protein BGO65_11075 [Afipia sp. 64-13]